MLRAVLAECHASADCASFGTRPVLVPKSWAVAISSLLVFSDDGATATALATGVVSTLIPPSGLAFANVLCSS